MKTAYSKKNLRCANKPTKHKQKNIRPTSFFKHRRRNTTKIALQASGQERKGEQ